MIDFILYTLFFAGIYAIVEILVRKKLKIKSIIMRSNTKSRIHLWGQRLLYLGLFISVTLTNANFFMFLFIVLMSGLDTFFEWKDRREEKAYVLYGLGLVLFIFYFSIGSYFNII